MGYFFPISVVMIIVFHISFVNTVILIFKKCPIFNFVTFIIIQTMISGVGNKLYFFIQFSTAASGTSELRIPFGLT